MEYKVETSTEELPALPAEVTAQWLGSKLGHKIKSVSMTRTIFGTNSKLFFSIEYADDVADTSSRPTHICVKGVFDPVMAESQPWTVSLAQREADFFTKIAPIIKHMGYPKGWWGGTTKKQGISIMTDLTHEGCTFPPEAASYPLEKVLDGAAQIAGLHAQFWGKSQEDYPCEPEQSRRFRVKHDTTNECDRDLEQLRPGHDVYCSAMGQRCARAWETQVA